MLKHRRSLLFTCLVLLTLDQALTQYAGCAFTQNCPGPIVPTICTQPAPVTNSSTFPWDNLYATQESCPEFYNSNNVCCNAYQIWIQSIALGTSDQSFGSQNGGCDVCAANLRRFWCTFTCSPNQADFLVVGDLINYTVPTTNQTLLARSITIYVDEGLACALYQSCQKTAFLTELSQTSTALGFLTFLGANGAGTSQSYLSFVLTSNNATAMNFQPHDCGETFNGTDQYGYSVPTNCSCNTCLDACQAEAEIEIGAITDGLDMTTVIITYAGLFILAIGCQLFRIFKKKRVQGETTEIFLSQNN